MTRFCRSAFLGTLMWLLMGCAAGHPTAPPSQTSATPFDPTQTPAPQPSARWTPFPTAQTLRATLTPVPAPQPAYLLTVLSAQERPDEMPLLPYRDDNFAQSQPWEIPEAFHPADGMRFFALQVVALNADQTNWQFNPSALELTDESGATYPAQLGRAAQGLTAFDLRPGQWTSGWVVFELPAAAAPRSLMYRLPRGQRLDVPLDSPPPLPKSNPENVTSTHASGFGWSLRVMAVKDPGEPFSTFSYTYIAGYRPVNILLEVTNQSSEEASFYPNRFMLMDEQGRLYGNNPGGASHAFDGGDLLPGETRQGEVSFDLPEGVRPSQLFLNILPFTNQVLQVHVQP